MLSISRRSPTRRARPTAGFTLTELLVVIALIALLAGLLLAALGQVQQKAKQTTTSATMQAFSNAAEVFRQEQGFYPGFVPENVLIDYPKISGTENAIVHMMGGFARETDGADPAEHTPANGWDPLFFGQYKTWVSPVRIGDGPVINEKPFPSYFTPNEKEFGIVEGQLGEPGNQAPLPDLLDAWGQPIIFLRAQRGVGPLTDPDPANRPQFSPAGLVEYCASTALGNAGRNQVWSGSNPGGSILSGNDGQVSRNLRRVLEHPALPGQARGRFMLLSAGKDGVYFSAQDGPGSVDTPVYDVDAWMEGPDGTASIFDEYDDVLIFGGGS